MSLLAHYLCNDSAANTVVADSSGNGNNGTSAAHNTSTLSTTGKIGTGFLLDGTSDYITGPALSALAGSITYAAWVYLTTVAGGGKYGLIDCLNNSTYADGAALILDYSSVGVLGYYSSVTGWKAGPGGEDSQVLLNAWNHIAISVDAGAGGVAYRNGSTLFSWSGVSAVVAPTQGLRVGQSYAGNLLKGKIDDVRVYNTALTGAQIASIYNAGSGTEADYPWLAATLFRRQNRLRAGSRGALVC